MAPRKPEPFGKLWNLHVFFCSKNRPLRYFRFGAALLVLIVGLILMAIGLSVVVPRAVNDVKRAKEDELRFALREFRTAISKFTERYKRPPKDISELLRSESGEPFLRRNYIDPFTGKSDWIWEVVGPNGPFVRSNSSETSLSGVEYSNFR